MARLSVQRQDAAVLNTFLVGDVGGTYARLAIACEVPDEGCVRVLAFRKYACADYADLAAIVRDFSARHGDVVLESGVLACAGCVLDGVVINKNLPWKVDIASLQQALSGARVSVINDLEAAAFATRYLREDARTWFVHVAPAPCDGPQIIVAPGTGLGAAVIVPDASRTVVMATEAGQMSLATGSELEAAVHRVLARSATRVTYEHVLSGPGLLNLYRALCDVHGRQAEYAAPDEITSTALHAPHSLAHATVEMFCSMLGAFVGDLTMLYRATGGVWLAGGFLPQIRELLLDGPFTDRFLDKGELRPLLANVPVRLIEDQQLGVIGAAGWYINRTTHRHDASSMGITVVRGSESLATDMAVRTCHNDHPRPRKAWALRSTNA